MIVTINEPQYNKGSNSPLSPEYSKAGGARSRSQADRLVGRRRSAGRLSCTSRATPRTVPAAIEGDTRRFPKGERKALWCAHRRIPHPKRLCAAPHKKPPFGGKKGCRGTHPLTPSPFVGTKALPPTGDDKHPSPGNCQGLPPGYPHSSPVPAPHDARSRFGSGGA